MKINGVIEKFVNYYNCKIYKNWSISSIEFIVKKMKNMQRYHKIVDFWLIFLINVDNEY